MSKPSVRQPRPALVIRRRFNPDPERCAAALARLLAMPRPALHPEQAPAPETSGRRSAA